MTRPLRSKGVKMAYKDVLKHIDFNKLSARDRDELRRRFQARKRDLEAAVKTIDDALAQLRPTAKRKTARHK
jgi:hypothetical protein